jgi:mRNA interferase MazF
MRKKVEIKSGRLYWADIGLPRGAESGKIRPVLVIQTDLLNALNHGTVVALLCTSQLRGESILRTSLPVLAAGNKVETEILIDQIRSVDRRYFSRLIGAVPNVIMKDVRRKLATILS